MKTVILTRIFYVLSLAICVNSQALSQSRFFTQNWVNYEGRINNNKNTGERTRVNDRGMSTHPNYSVRFEAQINGLALVDIPDTISQLDRAELFCEMWGGHPKTANKRFQINGGRSYPLPSELTAAGNCEYLFPHVSIDYKDLVSGTNALQFNCDRGNTFWGHFLMEEIAINCYYNEDAPIIKRAGLSEFSAVPVIKGSILPESAEIWLNFTESLADKISEVHYFGYYLDYDWNGSGSDYQWHGYQFKRKYTGHIGSSVNPPFKVSWDTRMIPTQGRQMAVKALIVFKNGINYWSDILNGIVFPSDRQIVQVVYCSEMPVPFWSRDNQLRKAVFELPVAPEEIEQAELYLRIWDGGEGNIKEPFRLNGIPYKITQGDAPHDLVNTKRPVSAANLNQGKNYIELLSDTEHHGIEICLPGPALIVRYKKLKK